MSLEKMWKDFDDPIYNDSDDMKNAMLADMGYYYIPNIWDKEQYLMRQYYPHTKKSTNFRQVKTCYNCKHVEKMECGSHIEWGCGVIIKEYISEYDGICDLYE